MVVPVPEKASMTVGELRPAARVSSRVVIRLIGFCVGFVTELPSEALKRMRF